MQRNLHNILCDRFSVTTKKLTLCNLQRWPPCILPSKLWPIAYFKYCARDRNAIPSQNRLGQLSADVTCSNFDDDHDVRPKIPKRRDGSADSCPFKIEAAVRANHAPSPLINLVDAFHQLSGKLKIIFAGKGNFRRRRRRNGTATELPWSWSSPCRGCRTHWSICSGMLACFYVWMASWRLSFPQGKMVTPGGVLNQVKLRIPGQHNLFGAQWQLNVKCSRVLPRSIYVHIN